MSQELEQTISKIDQLMHSEQLDEAQQELNAAVKTFGEVPELMTIQAEIYGDEGNYDAAIELTDSMLEKLDQIDQADLLARLHNVRGYAFYYLDQLEEARQEQNRAVKLSPKDYTAVMGRAMVHEDLNYLSAALIDLERAAELDPTEGQPHAIRASIFLRFGDLERCREALEMAVSRDEDDLDSRLELARFRALDGKTDDATELLTQILEADVDKEEDPELFTPAAILRAQLSLLLGSTDAALEDALLAQSLMPEEPWGYLQFAAVKIQAQVDGEEAISALKKAESIAGNILDLPDLFPLYHAAYQLIGKEHKAAKYQETAEGSPRLPAFVYGSLNPVENIPVNPNRPIDFRRLLDDLFGKASNAPNGYEEGLRKAIQEVMEQLPQIRAENPDIQRLEIQLPQAPGMIGGERSIIMQLNNQPADQVAEAATPNG